MKAIPQVWVLGNPSGFDAALTTIVSLSSTISRAATLNLAFQMQLPEPDLILICEQHPDEYRPDEVARLLAEHPLTRIVCAYGPWCAAAGRTRMIWPLAVRVPAPEAALRLHREARVINGDLTPMPRTAGLDEVVAFDLS